MIKSLQIQVSPETSTKIHLLKINVSNLLKIDKKSITHIEIKKKSIDARQKIIKV
jgi:hypothetical protein